MIETKPYNQRQYIMSRRHKAKCGKCGAPVIWMRTHDGRSVAVDPLKVINRTPGVPILDEDGLTLINVEPKVGWKFHECK